MKLLSRLAIRAAQELARNPRARAKTVQVLTSTSRKFNQDFKPRVSQAWRDAQPELKSAGRGFKRLVEDLRREYRKGRNGK
ncbi:uncharacterized protein METZ01_LOCUS369028 [marine metagenome]|uniref:Uncharacterized protein n=1 Tax=marine metagenome TaxID=408172 RepID=A0A382T1Y8_9ZZZZ